MTTINQKDADQDQLLALLTHRIEDAERMSEELRERVRKLEKWVWRAGAVISAAITIVGLVAAIPDAEAFVEDGLVGGDCASHQAFSDVVTEVSVKPSEEQE